MVFTLQPASKLPGGLVKALITGPISRVSDKVTVGGNLRICFSNKFPSDADVTGQGTIL